MDDFTVIGKSVPRVDALDKALGKAVYGYDMKLPGMLHAKVLRSKYPHAEIVSINTKEAEKLEGVEAIITAQDIPEGMIGIITQDYRIFAKDKVRYIGEPVAAVAAVTKEVAQRAIDSIEVHYQELPGLFDPLAAMETGAIQCHEQHGDVFQGLHKVERNICAQRRISKGNIAQGFAESEIIVENIYQTSMVEHCHLEPHAALATVDSSGKATIWSSTQLPFVVRSHLAHAFQIPLSKIRVIGMLAGGGFGGKSDLMCEPYCLALAQKTGKPVKMVTTRKEEFLASTVRHPMIIESKTGVKRDGTIVAKKIKIIQDCGAYCDVGDLVLDYACIFSPGPYRIPHFEGEGVLVYTNQQIGGPMRGFGVPQVAFAHESDMDIIAERLGMDPVEMRRRNLIDKGDLTVTGQEVTWAGPKETFEAVLKKIRCQERRSTRNNSRKKRGIGISCIQYTSGMANAIDYAGATLKMNEDGSVSVSVSSAELGQGAITVLSQIVAEELGLSVEDITINSYDTDITPLDTIGANATRTTYVCGKALKNAAEQVRNQLIKLAANALEAREDDLELKERMVAVKGSPEKAIPIADLCMMGLVTRGETIVGAGTYKTKSSPIDAFTGFGIPVDYYVYGASAAEVEVDPETGNITVLRILSSHDVGKAINPLCVEGQFEGGIVMGLGYALSEEIQRMKGETLNANLHDYKLPTPLDIPSIESVIVEGYGSDGPFGAKGVGEPTIIPIAPAIANAIYDAVGIRIRNLPITPEKIFLALKSKGGEGGEDDSSAI